jgi:hypothetical protein
MIYVQSFIYRYLYVQHISTNYKKKIQHKKLAIHSATYIGKNEAFVIVVILG